jgi:hypothetical protein
MIKKGIAKFRTSVDKVFKARLFYKGEKITKPSDVKCCDVCINEGFFCRAFCKYRSATYQEYLQKKFELPEALLKGLEKGMKEGAKYAKNFEHIKACENNFDSMPGNKEQ